jgi:hypothetical protein
MEPNPNSQAPFRFSLGAMFCAVAVVAVALAITLSNWAEYRREYLREDRHLFDILTVFQRYCVVWLAASIVAVVVATTSTNWEMRTLALLFAGFAAIACLINFLLPLGAM